MKRRTFLLGAAALLLCGAATSCSAQKTDDEPILQQIEYSNLTDENTQTLLTEILKDVAVSDARIRLFANHVQRFNQDMDSAWLTTGFETSEPSDLKYDPYAMQDLWAEKEGSFPGWNCRITAFGLFGDFVSFCTKCFYFLFDVTVFFVQLDDFINQLQFLILEFISDILFYNFRVFS